MSTTVLGYIDTRAPHYNGDARLTSAIEQATAETGENAFPGVLRNKAIFLLVVHWLTLADRDTTNSGNSGSIKREKEGKLEREYLIDFTFTKRYPMLSQTTWGLELVALRRSTIFAPRTRHTTAD